MLVVYSSWPGYVRAQAQLAYGHLTIWILSSDKSLPAKDLADVSQANSYWILVDLRRRSKDLFHRSIDRAKNANCHFQI